MTHQECTTESASADPDAAAFDELRGYLFTVAYRMVGSASEAEDIVQDAWLRAQHATEEHVRSPRAYLATVVTRLSLDHLRSARSTRETYIGQWLPEPVLTSDLVATPEEATEQQEEITLAFLLLLERLTPEERATYILREAFAFPYDEIAAMLDKSTAAVRQLARRSREHVQTGRARFRLDADRQRQLADRFMTAARTGDLTALMALLQDDVVGLSDGGASARAARRPIRGSNAVARWLIGVMDLAFADVRITQEEINGRVASCHWDDDRLVGVITIDATDSGIREVQWVVSPEKLAYLKRHLDAPSAP